MLYKNSLTLTIIFSSQLSLCMQYRNLPYISLAATNETGGPVSIFVPLELWHKIIAINGYEHSFKRVSKLFSLISRIRSDENIINRINTFLLLARHDHTPTQQKNKNDRCELVPFVQNGQIYQVLMPKKILHSSRDTLAKQPQQTTVLPITAPLSMPPPVHNVIHASTYKNSRIWGDDIPAMVNDTGHTQLHLAAQQGNLEHIRYLINEQNMSVNQPDKTDSRPLTYAIRGKHIDAVKLLHFLGADVNSVDSLFRTTPLFDAIKSKDLPIIHYLVDSGANLAHIRKTDDTLLHTAVETGEYAIVRYILEKQVIPINNISGFNETALSIACQRGLRDIAELLITHGADVNLRIEKKSPCDIAYAKQQYLIVTLLCTHNASHRIQIPDHALLQAIVQENTAWVEALIALRTPVTEHVINEALRVGNETITALLCNATIKS